MPAPRSTKVKLMRSPRLGVLGIAVVALAGVACGPPIAGDTCSAVGFLCSDNQNALECYGGTWRKLPCRGPQGCTRSGDSVKCDMSTNVAGDFCATTVARKGICTADLKATLTCDATDLTFSQSNTCRTCSVSGDTVLCAQ